MFYEEIIEIIWKKNNMYFVKEKLPCSDVKLNIVPCLVSN